MTCSLLAGCHLNLQRRYVHASNGFLTDQSTKVSIAENKMEDESAWGVRVQCGKIAKSGILLGASAFHGFGNVMMSDHFSHF